MYSFIFIDNELLLQIKQRHHQALFEILAPKILAA